MDQAMVDEASGLEVSSVVRNRLFHINDSGGGPYFYTTDLKGGKTKKIKVTSYKSGDSEALGYGPCGEDKCLYLAVIGDNMLRRKTLRITPVKDRKVFPAEVKAEKTILLTYPDGSYHDAEGFAVHPNGDFYVVTKEHGGGIALPAKVYRTSAALIADETQKKKKMEYIGEIDFPSLFPNLHPVRHLVTGFDISPDGKKALFITYGHAVELNLDLSKVKKLDEEFMDFSTAHLKILPQQEAIVYYNGGKSFLYNTEFHAPMKNVPLYRVDCQ
jgi:hypothetical protein